MFNALLFLTSLHLCLPRRSRAPLTAGVTSSVERPGTGLVDPVRHDAGHSSLIKACPLAPYLVPPLTPASPGNQSICYNAPQPACDPPGVTPASGFQACF